MNQKKLPSGSLFLRIKRTDEMERVWMKTESENTPSKTYTLLVSGFEPFGGQQVNPAQLLVQSLPARVNDMEIRTILLPVSFETAWPLLKAEMEKIQPDGVLCIGQAGGRSALTFEKVGINLEAASIADNEGYQPSGIPVVQNAPDGLFSTLPVEQMAAASRKAGIPAFVSYTAGTYVCNCLLYSLLEEQRRSRRSMQGGFLHVPWVVSQAAEKPNGTPSMSLENMKEGLLAALEVLSPSAEENEKTEAEGMIA